VHLIILKGGNVLEEEQLVRSFQNGSMEAFDLLYEKYKNQALRSIYLISNSRYDCEDIVQEAFVKMYTHIGELKDVTQFKSWFFQILYRTAWQYMKKKTKETPSDEIENQKENHFKTPKQLSALDELVEAETKSLIKQEIEKLDIKHRTVIVLYYYNELSIAEIAKIVGCFEGTVKSRLANARKRLRVLLQQIDTDNIVYLSGHNNRFGGRTNEI
jgi:RNA polymerase sigma-70 factor (ECF subfamily)